MCRTINPGGCVTRNMRRAACPAVSVLTEPLHHGPRETAGDAHPVGFCLRPNTAGHPANLISDVMACAPKTLPVL